MSIEQKRYLTVFTGFILVILGGLLYMQSLQKSSKFQEKQAVKAFIKANQRKKVENVFVPYSRPTKLNFVYDDGIEFKRSVSLQAGLKKFVGDKHINDWKVVCNGKNCSRQVLTSKATNVLKSVKNDKKVKVIRHNVVFSKGKLDLLKSNTKIIGDVYIKNINFIRIPKNFKVEGNIYVINSNAITFMGDNLIDGHIYLSGKSSIRAFPKSVKMTGQIFM